MIHNNLIRRNQLIYAKMLAQSIHLTRPLIVTELPVKKLLRNKFINKLSCQYFWIYYKLVRLKYLLMLCATHKLSI